MLFVCLFNLRLFGFCLLPLPLPLNVWEELRLVSVALPGLFSYLFVLFRFTFMAYQLPVRRLGSATPSGRMAKREPRQLWPTDSLSHTGTVLGEN